MGFVVLCLSSGETRFDNHSETKRGLALSRTTLVLQELCDPGVGTICHSAYADQQHRKRSLDGPGSFLRSSEQPCCSSRLSAPAVGEFFLGLCWQVCVKLLFIYSSFSFLALLHACFSSPSSMLWSCGLPLGLSRSLHAWLNIWQRTAVLGRCLVTVCPVLWLGRVWFACYLFVYTCC